MKSHHIKLCFAMMLIAITMFSLVGCSSDALRDRAQDLLASAESTETLSDNIEQVLERFPPGSVEDNELADAIRTMIPGDWQDSFDHMIQGLGDTREAAVDLSAQLDAFAALQRRESNDLIEQADKNQTGLENLAVGGVSAIELVLGGSTVLSTLLAGIFERRRRRESDGRTRSESAMTDLVTSIKSSEKMQAAINGGGGAQLRQSMMPETMAVIRQIKDTH